MINGSEDIGNNFKDWLLGFCQFSVDPEHPFYLGCDIISQLSRLLYSYGHEKALVITDSEVERRWGKCFGLSDGTIVCDKIIIPAGEAHKNMGSIELIHKKLLDMEADRQTAIIGVGGGMVSDIAGFAASIFMRGLPLYLVPTTLLAMVDASIGGKNGIDLSQGKNLIGTFYWPKAVFADLGLLTTLPSREISCGLVEALKTAIVGDEEMFATLENFALEDVLERPLIPSPNLKYHPVFDVVKRAVIVKSQIVMNDFRDSGERMKLNLGHTLGHALEVAGGYSLLNHGEAIGLGILAALRVAKNCGMSSCDIEGRVLSMWQRWNLPTRIPKQITWEDTERAIKRDKKRHKQNLTLVLPASIGDVHIVTSQNEDSLREAFESLRA